MTQTFLVTEKEFKGLIQELSNTFRDDASIMAISTKTMFSDPRGNLEMSMQKGMSGYHGLEKFGSWQEVKYEEVQIDENKFAELARIDRERAQIIKAIFSKHKVNIK